MVGIVKGENVMEEAELEQQGLKDGIGVICTSMLLYSDLILHRIRVSCIEICVTCKDCPD